jgi:hypothetical protein
MGREYLNSEGDQRRASEGERTKEHRTNAAAGRAGYLALQAKGAPLRDEVHAQKQRAGASRLSRAALHQVRRKPRLKDGDPA